MLAPIAAAVLGGGGMAVIVNAFARRSVTKVEAAARLSDSALEIVDQVRSDTRADVMAARSEAREARTEAAEARREATKARDEAAEAHRQMRVIKVEAEELAEFLGKVVRWIQSPDMSMERLRVLVSQSGPLNGVPRKE